MFNWGLMKHPLNWATILLMVVIGGVFLRFVVTGIQQAQSKG